MKNNNIILYAAILIFGVLAPFMLPAFKVQLSILCILIVLALTWNIQGGEMGYNSFGNILFYGLGMYICASVQVGMFFPLAEWTESGGEKTFVHSPTQFFQGMAFGLLAAAIIPTIVAGLIGYAILGLRGHYFSICTLGLGVFEEFADYILGTEFRIGSVFLLLVLILVYRRFKLSKKREYLK